MPEQSLPVIVEPFSRFADEVAGDSVEELARNLVACTRLALTHRCKPRRPLPDPWQIFRGWQLSPEVKQDLAFVARVYADLTPKPKTPTRAVEMELALL